MGGLSPQMFLGLDDCSWFFTGFQIMLSVPMLVNDVSTVRFALKSRARVRELGHKMRPEVR